MNSLQSYVKNSIFYVTLYMNCSKALISIVIPVYNRAAVVTRTLDSVFAQTARPLQLILVDNASTDGSAELLRQWAATHDSSDFGVRLLSEPQPGAARARNCGLRAVDTPWTMFFDSDDLMRPGHVDRALQAIERCPQADIFGWDVIAYDAAGHARKLLFEPVGAAWHNLMHGMLATLRYCARTELFRRAGGWCDSLATWDDIELGTRLLCLGPQVVRLGGEPTVEVYYSDESVTGPGYAASMQKSLAALGAIARNYGRLGPLSHVRLKQAILAADCVREGRTDARSLLDEALRADSRRLNRLAYRLAYRYRLAGGRGAARLFKPLLR